MSRSVRDPGSTPVSPPTTFRGRFLSVAALVWAVVVCVVAYLVQPPILIWMPALRVGPYIPWEVILPAFTWLGLLIFAARGVGGWLLQRFGRLDLSRAEEWVFSLGLGGGVIAYATLTAAVAGGLYRWPARLAVLALAAWGVSRWWRRRSLGEVRKLDEVRFPRLPMVLALLAWGVNLLGVLGPETFYDSLLYHLGVPQWYVNVHRMAPTPHMIFAPLPFMQEMLYFVGLSPDKPRFDRFNWREKFDYFAIFWGMPVIGIAGIVLMYPVFTTQYLPAWVVPVALIAHGDEALLAVGWIIMVHLFFNHMAPGIFPLNKSIFTGKVPLERYRREHPLEYERRFAPPPVIEESPEPSPQENAEPRPLKEVAIELKEKLEEQPQ